MTSTPIKKLQDNSPSKMDDPMQSARIAQGMEVEILSEI